MRAKIKIGTPIFHDHWCLRWPMVSGGEATDPDKIFDVEKEGQFYVCRADGFGRREWDGETGGYGSGSIIVQDREALIEVKP